MDKDEGYQKAKAYRQSLMDLVHKSSDNQQAIYSPSKRTRFDSFCQKCLIYLEGVLPNTRQEWFEAMGYVNLLMILLMTPKLELEKWES